MNNFHLNVDELEPLGRNLHRPECVLCTRNGSLFVSDWRGGVTHLAPDGSQEAILDKANSHLRPNGIALLRDGSFLLADMGEAGGVWRLDLEGKAEPFIMTVDGIDLSSCNFVMTDSLDRVWITVSTQHSPRSLGYRPDIDDGFIVLKDSHGARIVADGISYTNEIRLDVENKYLYVVETFGRRLSQFQVDKNGQLSNKKTVSTFGHGIFPDGLCLDSEGGIWITSVVSNRLIRIAPDGSQHMILEDCDPEHLEIVEQAFLKGQMGRKHLDTVRSHRLRHISSLAFGGSDLCTIYLGSLMGDHLLSFRSPFSGQPPVHWEW